MKIASVRRGARRSGGAADAEHFVHDRLGDSVLDASVWVQDFAFAENWRSKSRAELQERNERGAAAAIENGGSMRPPEPLAVLKTNWTSVYWEILGW